MHVRIALFFNNFTATNVINLRKLVFMRLLSATVIGGLLVFTAPVQAQTTLKTPNQDSIQQVTYQNGLAALKKGAYNESLTPFTQLITGGFPNKEVYVKRGVAYYFLGTADKAKLDFDEAVKGRINTQELFEYRGLVNYKLENFQTAATDLDKAVAMGAKSFDVYASLGNAKFRLNNFKDAIVSYDNALSINKTD